MLIKYVYSITDYRDYYLCIVNVITKSMHYVCMYYSYVPYIMLAIILFSKILGWSN